MTPFDRGGCARMGAFCTMTLKPHRGESPTGNRCGLSVGLRVVRIL